MIMRKTIILVILSVLLSSCYSYKNVQHLPSESGGIYKITEKNESINKIKIIEIRQDSLVVLKNGQQSTIANSDFTNLKKRKFSPVKTVALYVGVSVVVGTAIIVAVLGSAFKNMGPIRSAP